MVSLCLHSEFVVAVTEKSNGQIKNFFFCFVVLVCSVWYKSKHVSQPREAVPDVLLCMHYLYFTSSSANYLLFIYMLNNMVASVCSFNRKNTSSLCN